MNRLIFYATVDTASQCKVNFLSVIGWIAPRSSSRLGTNASLGGRQRVSGLRGTRGIWREHAFDRSEPLGYNSPNIYPLVFADSIILVVYVNSWSNRPISTTSELPKRAYRVTEGACMTWFLRFPAFQTARHTEWDQVKKSRSGRVLFKLQCSTILNIIIYQQEKTRVSVSKCSYPRFIKVRIGHFEYRNSWSFLSPPQFYWGIGLVLFLLPF